MSAPVTCDRVTKYPTFEGRLPDRPLYVYLPPGYDESGSDSYPLLIMHDGQNCFEAFAEDSFAGSWKADEAATYLIEHGFMPPIIIAGVGHGGLERMAEYLPPYATFRPRFGVIPAFWQKVVKGRADSTFDYYRYDVLPFLRRRYRVRHGRENMATCGSSMGGIFSLYLAWEQSDFARSHAALSPSVWTTHTGLGHYGVLERVRSQPKPDIRLWLDSGTRGTAHGGTDDHRLTRHLGEAIQSAGFKPGVDFQYFLDEGGVHNEADWGRRLPAVLRFLFPMNNGASAR